jgi:undecaprenyl-diphosphatase
MSLLLVTALILGAVEGLTEFLPVSSTGHLIIVGDMLNFNDERAKTFEIFIQLGAILSVVWHYRVKLWSVATTLRDRPAQRFVLNLAIAFLPAAVVGLLLHRYIKTYLFNPTTVALALIIGGVLILLIEHTPGRTRVDALDQLGPIDALKVGLAQTAALFPGISRAGATIMGGMVSGLSRPAATEFSFFLAIPTMFAATIFELYSNRQLFAFDDILILLVGFVIAFITALIVIRAFLRYVSRHNFVPFAYYRIVFGLLVLAYFW